MIDLRPDFLDILKRLLAEIVPDCEVRIFGSRYHWTATDASDLDLALVGPGKLHWKTLARLKAALEESSLPYRVDVLDWHAISPEFQKVIEQGYEVIQKSESGMSSQGWNTWKVGDIGRIVTGKTPPTQNLKNFGNRYPFITPRDMLGQKRIQKTERYLSEEGKNTVRNCLLPAKSVCVSCIGSDMGKVVMTTIDSVTNQQLNSVICNSSFDPDFVYYALVHISDELRNAGHSSTAVPILNKTDFSNFEITAPDVVTQRSIANILTALDDKIELNRQTNATLEAIAQAIFKEWFVDFNFPGATGATGEIVESEMGMIPKGWRVYTLGELIDSVSITHKLDSNGVIFLNTSDIEDGKVLNHNRTSIDGLPGQAKKSIKKLDILFTEIRPANKRFALIDFDADDYVVSTKLMVLRAKAHVHPIVIYNFITSDATLNWLQHHAESRSGTFPQITFEHIRNLRIALPQDSLLERYSILAWSAFQQIKENEQQSTSLAQIHDTLLPKLMSGEIEV